MEQLGRRVHLSNSRGSPGPASQGRPKPVPLGDIGSDALPRVSSGVPELDRVLGGGWVPGSVTLLGGEPGIGKSTLALQATAQLDARSVPTLYVSGEESPEQIRMRAERLGAVSYTHLTLPTKA